MHTNLMMRIAIISTTLFANAIARTPDSNLKWEQFFTQDGEYGENASGWLIRDYEETSEPPRRPATWQVRDKILYGTGRYTDVAKPKSSVASYLMSARQYNDFVLETEFRFQGDEAWGAGTIALRAPLYGDPSSEGVGLLITDERFQRHYNMLYPDLLYPDILTGALDLLSPPKKQVYRPGEWHRYRIEARGQLLKVWLNGELIQDLNLGLMTAPAKRHTQGMNYALAKSGTERPTRGHIGFKDESERGTTIMFRNTRIAELAEGQ